VPKIFHRTRQTWLLYLAYAVFGYIVNCLGPVTPFLKAELNLSYTVSSLHFSAYAIGLIMTSLVSHIIVGRLGRRVALWLGMLGMGASGLVLIAAGMAWLTIGASFAMGVMGCLMLAVIPAGLADEHGDNRSIALSESTLVASISSAVAPLMIGWFSYSLLGWRFALVIPLLLSLVLFAVMGKTAAFGAPVPAKSGATQTSAGQPARSGTKLPLRYWVFWLGIFCSIAIEYCMLSWCADYLEKVVGLPKAEAAQALSVFLAGIIIGRVIGSRLLMRFNSYQVVTASLLICAAGFTLFWSAGVAGVAIAGLFITGIGVASQFPLNLSLALGASGGNTVRASAGATLASGIAILVLPLVLGRLADSVGIRWAYGVVLVLAAASFVLIRLSARGANPKPSGDEAGPKLPD
jgi:fucose permease